MTRAESAAPVKTGERTEFGNRLTIVSISVAALALILTGVSAIDQSDAIPVAIRLAILYFAMFLIPGIPAALLLGLPSRLITLILGVSLSLAVNLVVSLAQIQFGFWHPLAFQAIVAIAALVLAAVYQSRPAGRPGPATARSTHPVDIALTVAAVAIAVAYLVQAKYLYLGPDGPYGLVAQLPWPYWALLAALAVVTVVALFRPQISALTMTACVAAIGLLTTTAAGIYDGVVAVPTAFVHRLFIELLLNLQQLPPPTDARFSWAGFFAANAQIAAVDGIANVAPYVIWWPVVITVAVAAPVYSIGRTLTGSTRWAWVAVVLYTMFNWFQQDYFSPQSIATFMYASIIAVLLWLYEHAPLGSEEPKLFSLWRRDVGRPEFLTGRTFILIEVMIVAIAAGVVIEHQITPICLVLVLIGFWITGATRSRYLWIAVALVFAMWFTFGAADYWHGHIQELVKGIGAGGDALSAGVSGRLRGDPTYVSMQYTRIALSVASLVLAGIGWLALKGSRYRWVSAALVAAPAGLIFVQTYGGEIVIRVFVMATPVIAALAALGIRDVVVNRGRMRTPMLVAVALIGLLLLQLMQVTTRGLNSGIERTSADQYTSAQEFRDRVPANSVIVTFGSSPEIDTINSVAGPTKTYSWGPESRFCRDDLAACVNRFYPDYVIITGAERQQNLLLYGVTEAQVQEQITKILGTGQFIIDSSTPDFTILRRPTSTPIGVGK